MKAPLAEAGHVATCPYEDKHSEDANGNRPISKTPLSEKLLWFVPP
jgi:hypothetical protein